MSKYTDIHAQHNSLVRVIIELSRDILSEDETTLKAIIGTVLYEDDVVQEVLTKLENGEFDGETILLEECSVIEELLDCYFQAIYDKSLYDVIDVQNFRFWSSDLIDLVLEYFENE